MPEIGRKLVSILRILDGAEEPLGSSRIAAELASYGIDLTERAIRYHLSYLDAHGLTENRGRKGRVISEAGRRELADASVSDKVALINARLDALAYQTTFSLGTRQGRVILNVSLFPEEALEAAKKLMRPVFLSQLCTSTLVRLYRPGESVGDSVIPAGMLGLGTVCSVTLNGLLLKAGIPMHSEFGGLLELTPGQRPARFTEIIHYGGTSLDPLEIFIKGRMTSVGQAARGETGKVGAGFRIIPAAAREEFLRVTEAMKAAGLFGVAAVGRPSQSLLEIPVPPGRVGVIVYAGLNPAAALEEAGIQTVNKAMTSLVHYSELADFRRM